jgi:hypothetical protein
LNNWFIPDHAISSFRDDQFDHKSIADQLAEAIKAEPHAVCIGLMGRFGVGKSSVANLTVEKFQNDPKFDLIIVSADRHSGAARSRNLVTSIASQLVASQKLNKRTVQSAIKPLHSSVSIDFPDPLDRSIFRLLRGEYGPFPWQPLSLMGVLFLALVVLSLLLDNVLTRILLNTFGLLGLTAMFAAALWYIISGLIRSMFADVNISEATPRAEASDDVERVFSDIVTAHYAERDHRKLVVFVDDVDRLDSDDALEALRAIRSLQSVPKGKEPIFVLSCDDSVLEKAVATSKDRPATLPDGRSSAKSFLEKYFSIRVVMPPAVPGDMRDFANILIPASHPLRELLQDNWDPITMILTAWGADSPRRVIRRLNDYIALYQIALRREDNSDANSRIKKGDVTEYAILLARIMVIRDECPLFMEAVANDLGLLEALDRKLLGRPLDSAQQDSLDRWNSNYAENSLNGELLPILHNFLRSTARYIPREYPKDLTGLIYLSHTRTGRLLGNARLQSLMEAVRTVDKERVAIEVAEVDLSLHRQMARGLADAIWMAPEVELVNMIPGATSALPILEAGSREFADSAANALLRHPEIEIDATEISQILRHCSDQFRHGLERRLIDSSTEEAKTQRNQQMLVAAEYLVSWPGSELVSSAISLHWDSLVEDFDWVDTRLWLDSAILSHRDQFGEIIDRHFIVALLGTLRESRTYEEDDEDRVVAVLSDAEQLDSVSVSNAVAELSKESPALMRLGLRAIKAMNLSGSTELATFLAALLETDSTSNSEKQAAIRYLAEWRDSWAVSSEDDAERYEASARVVKIVVAALEKDSSLLESVLNWFDETAKYISYEHAGMAAVTIAPKIIEHAGKDLTTAESLEDLLLSQLDQCDQESVETVVKYLLAPILDDSRADSGAVQLALRSVPKLAESKNSLEPLGNAVTSWAQHIQSGGVSTQKSVAAYNKVGLAPTDLRTENMDINLIQELQRSTPYNRTTLPTKLSALANIDWNSAALESALVKFSEDWNSFNEDDQRRAPKLLSRALDQGVDIPTPLPSLIINWSRDKSELKDLRLLAGIWESLNSEQKSNLLLEKYRYPTISGLAGTMSDEELLDTAFQAARSGHLTELWTNLHLDTSKQDRLATSLLSRVAEYPLVLSSADLKVIQAALSEANRNVLSRQLVDSLPRDNEASIATLRVINVLDSVIETGLSSDLVASLLPEANEDLAYELGIWRRGVGDSNAIKKSLTSLRKNGHEAVASKYVLGHGK